MDSTMEMEELFKELFARVADRITKEVPVEGRFERICEGFENPDKRMVAERFWLEVYPSPKGLENYERLRSLALHAGKKDLHGENRGVHILIHYDTKENLLTKLRSNDPDLLKECLEQTENLSYHLIGLA